MDRDAMLNDTSDTTMARSYVRAKKEGGNTKSFLGSMNWSESSWQEHGMQLYEIARETRCETMIVEIHIKEQ